MSPKNTETRLENRRQRGLLGLAVGEKHDQQPAARGINVTGKESLHASPLSTHRATRT
jgi:hypothetical protein